MYRRRYIVEGLKTTTLRGNRSEYNNRYGYSLIASYSWWIGDRIIEWSIPHKDIRVYEIRWFGRELEYQPTITGINDSP